MASKKALIQVGVSKCKKFLTSLGLLNCKESDIQLYLVPKQKGKMVFGYSFTFPESKAEIRFIAPSQTPNMIYAYEFGDGSKMEGRVLLDNKESGKILLWAVRAKYAYTKKKEAASVPLSRRQGEVMRVSKRILQYLKMLREGASLTRKSFSPEEVENVIFRWLNNPHKNTKEKVISILPNYQYAYMLFLADTKQYDISDQEFSRGVQVILRGDAERDHPRKIRNARINSAVVNTVVKDLVKQRANYIAKYGQAAYDKAMQKALTDAKDPSGGEVVTNYKPDTADIQAPLEMQRVSSEDTREIIHSLMQDKPAQSEGKTWERKYNKLLDDIDMLLTDSAVKGMFVYGPPGTGKTYDIRNIVSSILSHLEKEKGTKLKILYEMASAIASESALYQFFKNAEDADIVIFDEADKILQRANFANFWKAALGDDEIRRVVLHTKEGSTRVPVKAKFIFIANSKKVNDAVKSRLAFTSYSFTVPELVRKFKDTIKPEKMGVDQKTLFLIIDKLSELVQGDATKLNYRLLSRSLKYYLRDKQTWETKALEEINGVD